MAKLKAARKSNFKNRKRESEHEQLEFSTYEEIMSGGVEPFDTLRIKGVLPDNKVMALRARRVTVGRMNEFESLPTDERSAAMLQMLVDHIVSDNEGTPMWDEETVQELPHNTALAISLELANYNSRAARGKD